MDKYLGPLAQKQMTRKEFLATLGVGVASVMGLSTILRVFNGKTHLGGATSGYGSSTYGGAKRQYT